MSHPTDRDPIGDADAGRSNGPATPTPASVGADDPRRHLRVRLRAAQLLVHALRGDEGADGMRLAWNAAVDEFGTGLWLFGSLVGLLAEHEPDRSVLTERLQSEIARLSLFLEVVRVDGK